MLTPAIRVTRAIRNRVKPGCIVLCYHRVSDQTEDHWQNAVSVRNFHNHVALLSERHAVMTIGDLAGAIAAGQPPSRKSVVVTFDDGYAVNVGEAARVLREHHVPATFYLNTAWLERELFWWDEIVELARAGGDPTELEARRQRFKVLDDASRERELRESRVARPLARRTDLAPMTVAHIRALAADPLFTVGGHTHSHPSLAQVAPARQRDEIVQNKRALEEICGQAICHFSYPFGGAADFDETTIGEVRSAGFESAASTTPAAQRWPGDPYRIPRVSVKNWDVRKFSSKLDQLWSS